MAFEYEPGASVIITATDAANQMAVPTWAARDMLFFRSAYNKIPGVRVTGLSMEGTLSSGEVLYGVAAIPGTYTVQLDYMEDGASYGTWTAPLTVTAPAEPADPTDPPPPARHALSERLAAYLALPGDPYALELADVHLPVVEAFVYGYTRGRGFVAAEPGAITPAWDLAHVIVSAAARLTSNPEQLASYQTGDYSERPAVLNGWTLPELAILHRYRKRSA